MKTLASTQNKNRRTLTVMINIPYVYLPEILKHKDLIVSWESIEEITDEDVLDNLYVPKTISKSIVAQSMYLDVLENTNEEQGIIYCKNDILKELPGNKEVNHLLLPFVKVKCIITSSNWDSFFEEFCPKYSLFSENMPISFNSKKSFIEYVKQVEADEFKNQYDNLSKEEWQESNESTAPLELQDIAEQMYDKWNEEFEESEYHIPFIKDISEKYSDEMLEDGWITQSPQTVIDLDIRISASMCSNFSTEGTLEDHLNNKQELIHQITYV